MILFWGFGRTLVYSTYEVFTFQLGMDLEGFINLIEKDDIIVEFKTLN